MRSRGIFSTENGFLALPLYVASSGWHRLFRLLRNLADRHKLFARRLGAAVPGLAEKGNGGSGRLRLLKDRRVESGSGMSRFPDARENHGARFFPTIPFRRDGLHR